ncbi:hypothetical protein [Chryseobacterium sp. MP_3.2]|uniref:hypothetical protein n=1 Tax=Chryseobacterium sp. MP_3.2 TaxID=3071712 RepID=UPI002E0A3E1E|nr:hypothetical protein [Chryseobacterium sp. MP_3.2]
MKKNITIIGLIIVVAVLSYLLLFPKKQATTPLQRSETNYIPPEIFSAADSTDLAIKENKGTEIVLPETEKYYNENVQPALEKAAVSVENMSKISAVASGQVPVASITLPDNSTIRISKAEKIRFKDKYTDIVIERDSAGTILPAKYEINTDLYAGSGGRKTNFFWQKEAPVDIFKFSNPYIKITNVENLKKTLIPAKSIFKLQANGQIQVGFNNQNNNQISAGLNAIFNGGGFISPYLGGGKLWDFAGESNTYGVVGANINILNVKK